MIRVGSGRADLCFPDGLGLYGYGPLGGSGVNVPRGSADADTLQARALYIQRGARKLLVVSYDLPSGSRVVHRALLRALAREGVELSPGQLWVCATHSHSAPGHYLGNVYDIVGQWPALYRSEVAEEIVRKGLVAARAALHAPEPCRIGVAQRVLWGAGRNRSLRPFLANFDGDPQQWLRELGLVAPPDAVPEEHAVDPRLRVVAFVGARGEPLATWATWCCHSASIRRAPMRAYHRDWPGVAVDTVERRVPFALVHQGANGDVTALPAGARRVHDPMQRVAALGSRVAEAWLAAFDEACATASAEAAFELGYRTFIPAQEGLPLAEIGAPAMAGSEEFDPPYLTKALGEARSFPWRGGAQGPKLPALGPLQGLLRRHPMFRTSPEHPIGLLRLGDHLFFSSPFEQTTYAARSIEKELRARWHEVRGEQLTASPISLTGDYAGYLTTPAEYAHQNYEGGHTLYGRDQRATLSRIWLELVDTRELDASAPAYLQSEPLLERRVEQILARLPSQSEHAVDQRVRETSLRIEARN